MTAAARFTQADMERAVKTAKKVAGSERARVVFRLDNREIEFIIGESTQDQPAPETWSDDDV
ncbi:MAG: hypothetical protein CMG78_09375 [Marinobacter sp.]|nr:hypothetical protein [Marinobacter sp.]